METSSGLTARWLCGLGQVNPLHQNSTSLFYHQSTLDQIVLPQLQYQCHLLFSILLLILKMMSLKFLILPMNELNLTNLLNTHFVSGSMLNAGNITMKRYTMVSVLLGLMRKTHGRSVTMGQGKHFALTSTGCAQTTLNGALPRLRESGNFPQKL